MTILEKKPRFETAATDGKMHWLEAMRGGAALWVLLHHAKLSVDHFVSDMGTQPWLANGYLGVDFFFVLSGFIIAFASHRLALRGGGLREYASARLIRIYVPYLPIGIAMFALYLLLPGFSQGGRSPSLLTSLTLLPDSRPPALSVAWTLVHEMIFYSLYALSFLNRRLFVAVFMVWVATIVSLVMLHVKLPLLADYFLSPLNLCFVLGVLIFQLNRRVQLGARLAFCVGVFGLAIVGWQAMDQNPDRVWIALGFGLAVWAAASPVAAEWKVWRPLVVLGAASYSVYLVHNPTLSLLVRLLPTAVTAAVAYTFISTLALVAGLLYWRLYERPMLAWVRYRLHPRLPVAAVAENVGKE